jgi:thiamine transport system permease protein
VLAVLLGLPGAWLMARYRFRGKALLRALTTVPFVLPSIIVVLGFVLFFGNNGILNRFLMRLLALPEPPLRVLYSLPAILLAHAFYNFPVCIRVVSALWSRINPRLEEAGRSLGAHGLRLFTRVVLPQILPGILSSAALIFIFCLMSFAVILVLGGGPRWTTIEVEVYRLAKVSLDLKAASALALVGSCLSLSFLYAYGGLQKRASFAEDLQAAPAERRLGELLRRPAGILLAVYLAAVVLLIAAPLASVLVYSLQRRSGWAGQVSFSLEWYRRLLLESPVYLRAMRNTLSFGLAAVLLAVPLGTALAWLTVKGRFPGVRLLEAAAMLPLGVSSVILGLGYLRALRNLPGRLADGWLAIVLAHTVIAYPFVIRTVSAVLRKIRPSLPEAARSLGAHGWKLFWSLELPLVRSGLIGGAAFAFAISAGEISATIMLATPARITMPIAIYRLISSYNFFGACAMGVLLMAASFLAFLLIDRLAGEEAGL